MAAIKRIFGIIIAPLVMVAMILFEVDGRARNVMEIMVFLPFYKQMKKSIH